ncbi:hypothetical protein [Paremcibacter congregatus]|uniref:hypothetical protein n=1 Tax=Paremcibacter congregatus TaxID=2043170 RepID=UPI003A90AB42
MTKLQTTIDNDRLIAGQFGDITFGPWGIECSDKNGFITLTDRTRNAHFDNGIWHLPTGRLKIALHTRQINANRITIAASFTALDDIALQDAVIRLIFDKAAIKSGIINDQVFAHANSDKYRLFPTKQAQLIGTSGQRIKVTLTATNGADRFDPYLYLRDRDDHWIIHARLLPRDPVDQIWLRWANRFFTLSAADPIARWVWKTAPLKNLLWRMRERLGRGCPEIQAVPLNTLCKGQVLSLEVTCHFQ